MERRGNAVREKKCIVILNASDSKEESIIVF